LKDDDLCRKLRKEKKTTSQHAVEEENFVKWSRWPLVQRKKKGKKYHGFGSRQENDFLKGEVACTARTYGKEGKSLQGVGNIRKTPTAQREGFGFQGRGSSGGGGRHLN